MVYNAENGYGLKFTKSDEQYEDCIIYRDTKKEIIELADKIICSFCQKGLMEELNEMQAAAKLSPYGTRNDAFVNKFNIPAYFVNLILVKYNMEVLGW